ncbi:hypothetical protein Glove_364g54 [Diversispora epigaea]|uniref:RING-type domain-containing protein n=1 Tax=Diversispora epigaea TaxID=1348612 RepID=A0A397HCA5_9GLOM|nr:hypothetical protein Glove_364g54 [Diversispora epigaea]
MQTIYDRVPKHECIDERKTPTSSGHTYVDRNNNMTHEHITQTTERVYEKTEMDIMQINDTNDTPENSRTNATKSLSNLEWNSNNEENDKTSQDADILCPICLDIIKEAFIGRCGHSFCYTCIVNHLDLRQDCPTCGTHLMRDQIYPNFILNKILEKSPSIISYQNDSIPSSPAKQLKTKLLKDDLSIEEIDTMVATLLAKKQKIESIEREDELDLLLDFLSRTKIKKQELLAQTSKEIKCLEEDYAAIQQEIDNRIQRQKNIKNQEKLRTRQLSFDLDPMEINLISEEVQQKDQQQQQQQQQQKGDQDQTRKRKHTEVDDLTEDIVTLLDSIPSSSSSSSSSSLHDRIEVPHEPNLQNKKQRMIKHLDDLEQCYFSNRLSNKNSQGGLSRFSTTLKTFTRYSNFRLVNTLRYGDIFNTSSIVSTIEFDRDNEYFATAGVTKKIKIFEYGNIERNKYGDAFGRHLSSSGIIRDGGGGGGGGMTARSRKVMDTFLHYPIKEMACRSKISCLSWNNYIKSQIVSADYEGIVSLWDANTGSQVLEFNEHEKRAWSVDFGRMDPTKLASGSDDAKVKIWSTNQKNSVFTLESNANVCCVKFNPEICHHLAFGSADHHIHYYDLRHSRKPLRIYKGHPKAVSYVKFLRRNELISASTDSTLKLWDIDTQTCARTYTGHINEKNFVGLSTSSDWIACGSEDNSVFAYYKALSKPVAKFRFGNINPVTGEEIMDADPSLFVSSVCWKNDSNTLLAANSQGTIKVLELE